MRRKKGLLRKDSEEQSGGWQIIYSGFVLILLCFFIMLSSFAQIEEGKVMRFVKSFVDSVSILTGGLKFDSGKEVLPEGPGIIDKTDEMAELFKKFRVMRRAHKSREGIEVTFTDGKVVLRLADTILFDLGVAEISKDALPLLNRIGSIISKTPYHIKIEGHTDNLPIHTGKYPSNWELSTARAVSVLRYFIDKDMVSADRVSAVGFGEYRPRFANDSDAHRAKNRRVEIVIERGNPLNGKGSVDEKDREGGRKSRGK